MGIGNHEYIYTFIFKPYLKQVIKFSIFDIEILYKFYLVLMLFLIILLSFKCEQLIMGTFSKVINKNQSKYSQFLLFL
jgi:hypothetical protein